MSIRCLPIAFYPAARYLSLSIDTTSLGGIIIPGIFDYDSQSEVASMPETIHSERWISLQEACDFLGVKRRIMRWVDQRGMPAFQVGKLWHFITAAIDQGVKKGGASHEREVVK